MHVFPWSKLRSVILLHVYDFTLILFIEHRTPIGRPLRELRVSAESMKKLSPQARIILNTHSLKLCTHECGLADEWLDEDWKSDKGAPLYLL